MNRSRKNTADSEVGQELTLQSAKDRSKIDLDTLRFLAVGAVVAHVIATLLMMMMAFTKNTESTKESDIDSNGTNFSTTIVIAAFGGLVSCLWATVGAWEIWDGSNGVDLPKWEWHSRQFVLAILVLLVLTLCQWPALVVFTLHTLGEDVTTIIRIFNKTKPAIASLCYFHITSSLLLGLCLLVSIIFISRKLYTFQQLDEEDRNQRRSTAGCGAGGGDGDGGDSGDGGGEGAKLEPAIKVMIFTKTALDLIFLVNMMTVLASAVNSGVVISMLLHVVLVGVFIYLIQQAMCSAKQLDYENWLVNWRVACVSQMFCLYIIFWISFAILLLLQFGDTDFFSTVFGLSGGKVAMVVLSIIMCLGSLCIYGAILFLHARCMSALDEVASLQLISQMNIDMLEIE